MNTAAAKAKQQPTCWRKRTATDGSKRQCVKPGYPCWVEGSFGRQAQILCSRCIGELRTIGWIVRYQLESERPPEEKGEC